MRIDTQLKQWATDRQIEYIDAVNAQGSYRAAARATGSDKSVIHRAIKAAEKKAAQAGYAPKQGLTSGLDEGFHLKGTSTLLGPDGEVKLRWVKTQADREKTYELVKEAFEGFADQFRGLSDAPIYRPDNCVNDLMTVYPIGDHHMGMFSWRGETGEDYDLKIAEPLLVNAVDYLVDKSPPSRQALIVEVGDFFHADNKENRTLRGGNALDVDTRWSKVLRAGVRAMRRCIDRALEKHEVVKVNCVEGNHDDHSATFLAMILEAFYENNPRVHVLTEPQAFYYHTFGKCLIGTTHGHTCKVSQLAEIMAADRPKEWGDTLWRHWYTGHVHHDSDKDQRGCKVETLRTLAARDHWHHAAGYRSPRDMKCDVWHKEVGRIGRHYVTPFMLTNEFA